MAFIETRTTARRRVGVAAEHPHYKWWALSCTSLGMLLATINSGAFLFANSAAIVTDAFPREQLGLAMGTNTMVAAVGLVVGPVLGGALVAISWHWVFWFNVPFTLVGSLWAYAILRELAKPDHVRR